MGIAPPDQTPEDPKAPAAPAPPATPAPGPAAPAPPATPAPGPAAPAPPAAPAAPTETADQKAARLEKELKQRDDRIQDLSTTIQTIEQRQRELETKPPAPPAPDEIETESKAIAELMLTDPGEAARRNAALLRKVAGTAAQQAHGMAQHQSVIQKLRDGLKTTHKEFDDETIDYVMQQADMLAATGKFKTPDEAIAAAATLVKSKFDAYAEKRNATPPLPPAARVENGGNTPPAPAPKDEVLPTAEQEISSRRDALQQKVI